MTNTTANKDRRLGKGLAALLGTPMDEYGNPLPMSNENASSIQSLELKVEEIEANPFQPRREFNPEEIASLAESLKSHQQLQPVLVRVVEGRYQLISGERRWRAAKHAGLQTIRAEVREADDRLVAELAIIENLQRKDLNPIEKAMSFKRYIEEHQCKQDDLARRLCIDRSTIANLMRLLELPPQIIDWIVSGAVSAGHARALLPLGDEEIQLRICRQIIDEKWSVRAVENHVSELLQKEQDEETGKTIVNVSRQKRKVVSPQVEAMQQEMRMIFGTKVEIKTTVRGRGKFVVHFNDADEFERLRSILVDDRRPALRIAG